MRSANEKAKAGRLIVRLHRKVGQSAQDGLTFVLLLLRWYANKAGLSFSQSSEQSFTNMIHDRVNGKEDS